jgi:hypothetical protein
MIKTMKKSLVLAAAVTALTAIAAPSMASAAPWSPLNTYHNLSSPSSITFTIATGGAAAGVTCATGPTFASLVRTPASALMDLTSTTANLPCIATGYFGGCSAPATMIGLPLWNVDGTSGASNVKINSVNIQLGGCLASTTISGQLTGGVWSNLNRSLAFSNDAGLTWSMGGSTTYPVTVTANEFIKDTTSPFLSLP